MRARNREAGSIRLLLQRSYTAILFSLTVPLAVMLILLLVFVHQYNGVIARISCAAGTQQVLEEDLPGELWDIISGRTAFSEGAQYVQLEQLDDMLEEMEQTDSAEQQHYLTAAMRAADTLDAYVAQLGRQMERGAAVSQNESLYGEIVSVMGLTADMLDRYTRSAIDQMSALNRQISQLTLLLAVVTLLAVGSAVWAAVRTYRRAEHAIHEPIMQIERMAARIAQGDLAVRLPAPSVEELYPLAEDLNRMAEQLDRLIAGQIEQEKTLKKAELRALQAQITPHFVYNTLETIIWLAEEENTRAVIEMTMAFTDFLRISLSGGQDLITVAREEQHVRSYLLIQSVRYGSIMQYEIDIDPALAEKRMLKLMLQPLVENAIYHGIKNKRGRGLLRITGRQEGDWMVFSVSDNGIGMDEAQLYALRGRLTDADGTGGGYGLRNITQRLRLYGGHGLYIDSQPGQGTTVQFALPCVMETERKEN